MEGAAHRPSLCNCKDCGATLKPGIDAHYVSEGHLKSYLAKLDFRYNRRTKLGIGNSERHDNLLAAIGGKRLTYRRIGETTH